jgi:hypothetical protein
MSLPAEPTRQLIAALQTKLGEERHVMGERPADLSDLLPVVVLARRGGNEMASLQNVLGDSPILSADIYAAGLDAAYDVMRDLRQAMYELGARGNTGPIDTTDGAETAGVRRLTATWTYATH